MSLQENHGGSGNGCLSTSSAPLIEFLYLGLKTEKAPPSPLDNSLDSIFTTSAS